MENIPVRKYRTRTETQKRREEAMEKKREKLQKKLDGQLPIY